MPFTKEDVEYGGPEILKWDGSTETARLFVAEFCKTPIGAEIVQLGLKTSDNMESILAACQEANHHEDVSFAEFGAMARQMFLNGDLKLERAPTPPPTPPPPQLSASQLAWQEFRTFTDSHSTQECKARARVDAAYASFLHKNLEREMGGGSKVGDAATNLSERRISKATKLTDELKQFADDYRHMSTDQLRRLLNPSMSGEFAAAHYQRLFDQACAAGLI